MDKPHKPTTPPPAAYEDMKRRFPGIVEAYENLGNACHWQGPLDPKSRELIKLGIALGAALEGAARAHVRLAIEAGASGDEVRHAALLATTTVGFPSMMRSMRWVNDEIEKIPGEA